MLIVGAGIALCAAMFSGVEADPRAEPGAIADDAASWALGEWRRTVFGDGPLAAAPPW